MIGQLVFGSGGPRQGEREKLYGLPVLRVRADMDSGVSRKREGHCFGAEPAGCWSPEGSPVGLCCRNMG